MDFGQAEVLIPEIRNTLEAENLQFKDLGLAVVCTGPGSLPASVLPFPPPGLSDWLVRKPKSSAFRLSKPTRTVLTRKKQPELTPSLSKLNAKTFYYQLFDEKLKKTTEPAAGTYEEIIDRLRGSKVTLVGDGVERF